MYKIKEELIIEVGHWINSKVLWKKYDGNDELFQDIDLYIKFFIKRIIEFSK